MTLGQKLDNYSKLMPLDKTELMEAGVPLDVQQRIERLRLLYAHWVEYPNLSNREMVDWESDMMKTQGTSLSRTIMYEDMQLVSVIIGNLQAANKDFMRWRVTAMLEQDRHDAREAGDFKSAVAAADKIGKYHQLDKPDTPELDYEKIVPQEYVFTSDVSVLGIKSRKDIRKQIKKLNKEMGRIEDADYEEVESDG